MSSTPYSELAPAPVEAKRDAPAPSQVDQNGLPILTRCDQRYDFDPGQVVLIQPDESLLHDQHLNRVSGCELPIYKYPLALGACLTGVGILYVAKKTNIIRQDEIGIVTKLDGSPHLLTPGCHYSGCCTTVEKFQVRRDVIRSGNIRIIRVPTTCFGKAMRNGRFELLLPGRHVINDPLFTYESTVNIADNLIQHGTISVITVPANQIGACLVNGSGFFLEPGRHFINSSQFDFRGFVDRTTECITIGSKFRITVPAGRIGLGWERGEAIILEHGSVIQRDSPYFKYDGSVDITSKLIVHGAMKFVQVRQGTYGISYHAGDMKILGPGRHVLTEATHYFAGFVPGGQQTLSIEAVTSMSADNVGICFDSALTIQVVDPEKAVSMLGIAATNNAAASKSSGRSSGGANSARSQDFDLNAFFANIVRQAKLALSIIIGNNKLNEAFSSTARSNPAMVVVAESVEAGEKMGRENPEKPAEHSFKSLVHDSFMHRFGQEMLSKNGILVCDMSIEDIKIVNPELATAMSKAAVAATNLSAARIELEVNNTRARGERQLEVTRAQGQAQAMNIIAEAEANRIRTLDAAMQATSEVTQQRELIRAAGDVMGQSQTSIVLGQSVMDISRVLGGQLQQQAGRQ